MEPTFYVKEGLTLSAALSSCQKTPTPNRWARPSKTAFFLCKSRNGQRRRKGQYRL